MAQGFWFKFKRYSYNLKFERQGPKVGLGFKLERGAHLSAQHGTTSGNPKP
jgi:hypothetical protein